MTSRLEEVLDWETEEELDDVEDMMDEVDEWDEEEEVDEQEDDGVVQDEVTTYGRKLTAEERIERFFDKYENMEPMPLMEGPHLYRKITHDHVLELIPSLQKDIKVFEKIFSSETDYRLNRALLRLFANPYFQIAHEEYKNTWFYAPIPHGYRELDRVVVLLERFRRFTLTAKRFVNHHEMKTGDILLDGSIVVLMQGQPFRLRQGGGFSDDGRFHFDEVRSHIPVFVIGYTTNLDIEKIQQKWVQRTHADSMDGWMAALKGISTQFPSDWNGRPGFQVYRQVQAKFVDWYFANPDKVTNYYREKKGKKGLLLSDLPNWLKNQVINQMCKNPRSLKRDTKIVWKGRAYCLPSLMTYVESPIRDILEAPDDKRIYQINFALDSWYEWDKRTDITVLGEQVVPSIQMDLFEDSWVSPTGTEQMSLF